MGKRWKGKGGSSGQVSTDKSLVGMDVGLHLPSPGGLQRKKFKQFLGLVISCWLEVMEYGKVFGKKRYLVVSNEL